MQTLVLANHKGGVGKSSVAVQFSHYLVRAGKRVLFIDLDHQMNATRSLSQSRRATVSPVSAAQILAQPAINMPQSDFVLVPAARELSALEREGRQSHNVYLANFKHFLDGVDGLFDFCIIDTNGNPDFRLSASLALAHHVLCPVQLNQEAIDGVADLLRDVQKITRIMNPDLNMIGILPNMVQPSPFHKANFIELASRHAKRLIALAPSGKDFAFIPYRSVIPEAQASGLPFWELRKTSARDAWKEIEPSFRAISARMGVKQGAAA